MKILLFILMIVIFCSANAQEFRKIKVGFTVGRINPAFLNAASAEAAYRLTDRMTIGYRAESAFLANNSVSSSGLYYQFYFAGFQRSFRPFVSLGIAKFNPGDMLGGCGGPSISQRINTENKVGIFPRLGFDVGHLSLMVEADLAPKSKSTLISTVEPNDPNYHLPYTDYLTNSYVSFRIGFFFGGGKKKTRRPLN